MRVLLRWIAAFSVLSVLLFLRALAVDVYIDGERVEYTDDTGYPFAENGSILVPLYPTLDAFGHDGIYQDNPRGTVVVRRGNVNVSCNTSENRFYRNGTLVGAPYGLVWRGGPLYVSTDIFPLFDASVSIGGSGVLITRQNKENTDIGVYGFSYDELYRGSEYFGAKYEPLCGLYLGLSDSGGNIGDLGNMSEIIGKEPAAYTIGVSLGDSYEEFSDELSYAARSGKLLRVILSDDGDVNADTDKVKSLAVFLEKSGARILLSCPCGHIECDSFACTDFFRAVSDVFRANAPSVALVWQMCTGSDSIAELYPGDNYVDYIGVSVGDITQGDDIISGAAVFGYKKPIVLSLEMKDGEYDVQSISELLTYLPVKHPLVKALFFDLDEERLQNKEYINAVRSGVSASAYLESVAAEMSGIPFSFELCDGASVPPSEIRLCCDLFGKNSDSGYVIYKLGGRQIAHSDTLPYEVTVDFSPLAGKTAVIGASAYSKDNILLMQKDFTVNVSSAFSADKLASEKKSEGYAVLVVLIVVCLAAIVVISRRIRDIFA